LGVEKVEMEVVGWRVGWIKYWRFLTTPRMCMTFGDFWFPYPSNMIRDDFHFGIRDEERK
jgi:hypothetical protein